MGRDHLAQCVWVGQIDKYHMFWTLLWLWASCRVFGVGRIAKFRTFRMLLGVWASFKVFWVGRVAQFFTSWVLFGRMGISHSVTGGWKYPNVICCGCFYGSRSSCTVCGLGK